MMDRIIGLACLATVATTGVIWNYRIVSASRVLTALGLLAVGGCLLGFVGLLAAIAASGTVLRLAHRLPGSFPLRGLILRLVEVLASYRNQVGRLMVAFALSVPVHLMGCTVLVICLHAVGEARTLPLSLVLFAFPLGMLAIAVPITPAGVGVGQAAFYAVCNMAVAGTGSAAANAFTVYQAIAIPIYLSGLIPYLAYRKQIPEMVGAAATADA